MTRLGRLTLEDCLQKISDLRMEALGLDTPVSRDYFGTKDLPPVLMDLQTRIAAILEYEKQP